MEQNQQNNEYYTIDLLQILSAMWHKAWVLILVGILAGAMGFCWARFLITPTYSSSILLYVNNSSVSLGNTSFSISATDLTASARLVDTYTVLLKNRTTLERVIDKAEVNYTYKDLSKMITAGSTNETEVMEITVTGTDPFEAANIANCIAEVLPERVSEIIEGTSVAVVDSAIPNVQKVAPSITKYTVLGTLLGVFLAAAFIAVLTILDDTVQDEEYVLQTYQYPILARIPNLPGHGSRRRDYYYADQNRQRRRSDGSAHK